MTNEQINEMARYALGQVGKAGLDWYEKSVFIEEGIVRLYDGNGDYIYDFSLNNEDIVYKLKDVYKMDAQTKKMVKKVMSNYKIMNGIVTKTLTFKKGLLKRLFGIKSKENQK